MVQQGRGDQCITVIRWHLRERNDGLPTRLERRNRESQEPSGNGVTGLFMAAWTSMIPHTQVCWF